MAKMTVDELKTALKDEAGFSDEQLAGLTKPQLEKLADGYMRQSDYDRSMNEGKAALQKSQEDLAAASERLNQEMAEWAQLQSSGKTATEKMQKDLESAQAAVATLRARVSHLATQAGIDPVKALEGFDAPPPKPDQPDLTGYVKVTDLDTEINKRLGHLATGVLNVPTELAAVQYDHQQLFGRPMTAAEVRALTTEIVTRASTKNNQKALEPVAVWEELHKVPEAREAKSKKAFDDAVAAAEQRGREAALSEFQVPGSTNTPGQHAPIFDKARESKLQRPQPGQTVQTAAAALRSGKYRKEGAGAKPAA